MRQSDQGVAASARHAGRQSAPGGDWLSWLAAQRDWQGRGVLPRVRAEIEPEHARLMLVAEQLAKLKKPAPAPLTPAAAEMARREDMLLRVKSLGPAFSSRLVNELF